MFIRVYYEDTDCGGIVYHANYFKFCERARSEIFFNANSMPYTSNTTFVVKSINANYIAPAKLGDKLFVKTSLLELKKCSLILSQDIFRDDRVIFTSAVKIACVDISTSKATPLPQSLLKIIMKIGEL